MDVLFSNILCQDLHPLDASVGSTWNAGNPAPLHRWLVPTMDEESRQRLIKGVGEHRYSAPSEFGHDGFVPYHLLALRAPSWRVMSCDQHDLTSCKICSVFLGL